MNTPAVPARNEQAVFAAFESLLRRDLRAFVHKSFQVILPGTAYLRNWHIEAIAHQLVRVQAGESSRLLITMPPRALKSITVSVAFAAWLLGHAPTRKIIVISYSSDFAIELHRQFRMIIAAEWYRELFPRMRAVQDTENELVTSDGGGRYATSVGGTLTGRGADLIIIDDPLKAEEAASEPARRRVIDWYTGSLVSRLNDKKHGPIVAVQQRLHEDDLAGHLLRKGGWEHLDLPAIAVEDQVIELGYGRVKVRRSGDLLHPERESQATLDRIKAEIGSLKFSAQFQQRPVPLGGNLIKRAWFPFYDRIGEHSVRRIVQSWDIAMVTGETNDYSVCTTWQIIKSDYYLIDVFRGRLEYPDLRRKVADLAKRHGAGAILIENAGPGMALLQDFRRNLPHGMAYPIGQKPGASKVERMVAQSAKIEAGHVHLPREASWLDTFLNELLAFPNSRHDDQVDSVSQFLKWSSERETQFLMPGMGPKVFVAGVEVTWPQE